MSRFNQIELEFTTIIPPLDPLAQSLTICDPETGNILTQRSYLNLEGAQSWYDFLSATLTLPNCAILEMWMEQIDDDGTRTRIN
jgi:hypothetical protein